MKKLLIALLMAATAASYQNSFSAARSKRARTAAATAGSWSCAACTFVNGSATVTCEICASARTYNTSAASAKADRNWICRECSSTNPDTPEACRTCRNPRPEEEIKDADGANAPVSITVDGIEYRVDQAGGPDMPILLQKFERKGVRNNLCAFHAIKNAKLFHDRVSFKPEGGKKRRRGATSPYRDRKVFDALVTRCKTIDGIPDTMLEMRDVETLAQREEIGNALIIGGDVVAGGAMGAGFLTDSQKAAALAYNRGEQLLVIINPRETARGTGHWVTVALDKDRRDVLIFDSYPVDRDKSITGHPDYTTRFSALLSSGLAPDKAHEKLKEEFDGYGCYHGFHDRRHDAWVSNLITLIHAASGMVKEDAAGGAAAVGSGGGSAEAGRSTADSAGAEADDVANGSKLGDATDNGKGSCCIM